MAYDVFNKLRRFIVYLNDAKTSNIVPVNNKVAICVNDIKIENLAPVSSDIAFDVYIGKYIGMYTLKFDNSFNSNYKLIAEIILKDFYSKLPKIDKPAIEENMAILAEGAPDSDPSDAMFKERRKFITTDNKPNLSSEDLDFLNDLEYFISCMKRGGITDRKLEQIHSLVEAERIKRLS